MATLQSWLLSNCLFSTAGYYKPKAPQPWDVFWAAAKKLGESNYGRPVLILEVLDGGRSVRVAPISSRQEFYESSRSNVSLHKGLEGYNDSGLSRDSYITGDSSEYEVLPVEKLRQYKGRLTKEMLSSFQDITGITASSKWLRTVCAFRTSSRT